MTSPTLESFSTPSFVKVQQQRRIFPLFDLSFKPLSVDFLPDISKLQEWNKKYLLIFNEEKRKKACILGSDIQHTNVLWKPIDCLPKKQKKTWECTYVTGLPVKAKSMSVAADRLITSRKIHT